METLPTLERIGYGLTWAEGKRRAVGEKCCLLECFVV
jgi:hypothetical protein